MAPRLRRQNPPANAAPSATASAEVVDGSTTQRQQPKAAFTADKANGRKGKRRRVETMRSNPSLSALSDAESPVRLDEDHDGKNGAPSAAEQPASPQPPSQAPATALSDKAVREVIDAMESISTRMYASLHERMVTEIGRQFADSRQELAGIRMDVQALRDAIAPHRPAAFHGYVQTLPPHHRHPEPAYPHFASPPAHASASPHNAIQQLAAGPSTYAHVHALPPPPPHIAHVDPATRHRQQHELDSYDQAFGQLRPTFDPPPIDERGNVIVKKCPRIKTLRELVEYFELGKDDIPPMIEWEMRGLVVRPRPGQPSNASSFCNYRRVYRRLKQIGEAEFRRKYDGANGPQNMSTYIEKLRRTHNSVL